MSDVHWEIFYTFQMQYIHLIFADVDDLMEIWR